MQLAARIDASAEEVAGSLGGVASRADGDALRPDVGNTTTQRVEQTKQNTLRIVKAVVDYSPPRRRRNCAGPSRTSSPSAGGRGSGTRR